MRHSGIRLVLIAFLLLPACFTGQAFAAQQPPALPDSLDEAYQHILDNPGDKDALVQYAAMAAKLKNYEAAIPPLETLLMSDPDDADLQLTLGALYLDLGAKSNARQYFEEVESNPDAPEENVNQAKEFLRGL